MDDRYERAKAIFLAAALKPRAERLAFVQAECGEDEALRTEVLELMLHAGDAGDTLEAPAAHELETAEDFGLEDSIGPYRLLEPLGQGGMGRVYRAHGADGSTVALKTIRPGLLSPALLSRFARECEVLRRLDHPGIARFVDAGVADTPRGPVPFLATELIEGRTLRVWAGGEHSRSAILRLLALLADATHAAHEAGVVHRDLKPENVIVRADEQPVLLDFGVSRLRDTGVGGVTLTTPGLVVGSVRYMSPEQAEARPGPIDGRADLYALGVIGCELLLGRLPYDVPEDSLHRALVAVLTSPPAGLDALGAPLSAVLTKALAKRPEDRYASAADLASDLRSAAGGTVPVALRERRARSMPAQLARWGVGLLAVAALAGVFLFRGCTRSPRAREIASDPDRAVAFDCARLDSADFHLHESVMSRADIDRGLALLTEVQRDLERFPRRPYVDDLKAYAWWRKGEAHYFIGERYGLPDELVAAAAAWLASAQPDRASGSRSRLPDTTLSLYDRVTSVSLPEAQGAAGMALAAMSFYRAPLPNLQRALPLRVAGLTDCIARTCHGGDSLDAVPYTGHALYGLALNTVGGTYARIAEVANDTNAASLALRYLHRADSLAALRTLAEEHASLQQNLGRAFAQCGRLEHRPADLDSALAHLSEALAMRESIRGDVSRLDSRLELAAVRRQQARDAASEPVALLRLEQAGDALEEASRPGYAEISPRQLARVGIARAAVLIDRASLEQDVAVLDRADTLLAAAVAQLDENEVPVPFVDAMIEQARSHAVRGMLTRAPVLLVDATRDLNIAGSAQRSMVSPAQSSRLSELGSRVRTWKGERVSLVYP